MAVQQIVQDKGMFARVLFIVTQSHPTVSAISSWNKTGDEQIMSNNWRYILYYSHKITFPPKVWGWRRQAREQVHEHYSFLPTSVPLHKKVQNINMNFWYLRSWVTQYFSQEALQWALSQSAWRIAALKPSGFAGEITRTQVTCSKCGLSP